ncbi:MAG: hypothetical protein HZC45_03015 [Deltaproteobacteria bacterium]|nr:hypothetical protein [Deltaproteobacteria bacterium]
MTFKEFLKEKKKIDTDKIAPVDLMDEYYDDYKNFLAGLKDGCDSGKGN